MSENSERRFAPRREACVVAEIEMDGTVVRCSVARDASTRGLLLLTRGEIALASRPTLRLYVPGEDERRTLSGRVVRCEKIPAQERGLWSHRIAVAIVDPPDDLEALIDLLTTAAPAE